MDTTADGSTEAPSPVSASATDTLTDDEAETAASSTTDKPVIQGKHVRAAAKELGAEVKDKAPKMSEVIGKMSEGAPEA